MLSRTSEYALRALLFLARPGTTVVPAGRIAEATGAPAGYLAKTLQQLTQAGFVRAVRGRFGGYGLARPAIDISVGEIAGVFATEGSENMCLLGAHPCSSETPCTAHQTWQAAQAQAMEAVEDLRLADLIQDTGTPAARVALSPSST